MAFYPDLRKEVALAVAPEDQFGLSLRPVRLHRMRHYIRGGAAVNALNQQSRRSLCRTLDPILACRERHLPLLVNIPFAFTSRGSCARTTEPAAREGESDLGRRCVGAGQQY